MDLEDSWVIPPHADKRGKCPSPRSKGEDGHKLGARDILLSHVLVAQASDGLDEARIREIDNHRTNPVYVGSSGG